MKSHYTVNQKEQQFMNCFISSDPDFLQAVFDHMPEKIILHSERVRDISNIMTEYMSADLLPNEMNLDSYRLALSKGAYYHDIGVYLAGNDVERRPAAAEKLLTELGYMDILLPFGNVVFETVRSCCERYDGKGYPGGLIAEKIPFHASLCAIADAVDMMMGSKNKKVKSVADYIRRNSGILFRPDAVRCFEMAEKEIFDVYKQYEAGDNVNREHVLKSIAK